MYPNEVEGFIDFLDEYTENDTLETCHIMHLHPKGLAYPNGYYDSQFFELVIYNTETMQKRNVGKRDGLVFYDNAHIDIMRIFADGSTMVRFSHAVKIDGFQAVHVSRV